MSFISLARSSRHNPYTYLAALHFVERVYGVKRPALWGSRSVWTSYLALQADGHYLDSRMP
jgi:hypothetical protein